MKKTLLIICLALSILMPIHAQIFTWVIKPGKYDKIVRCWESLLYVYKDGKKGIVDNNGREIVPIEASRFTGFYNGVALELGEAQGGMEQILGILSKNGDYIRVNGTYFTIPSYEFFSEGYLVVKDRRGRVGFMDVNGQVLHMEFDSAYPFCEGRAIVFLNKEPMIINKQFRRIPITIDVGKILDITSCYNNIVFINDDAGKIHRYNLENNISNPVELNSFKSDFLRRFQFLTKEPDVVPEKWYVDVLESKKINFTPINQNGKYGYEKDHKTIGYCQFLNAEPFYQNMNTAIVETYRGVGLLSYNEGVSVRTSLNNPEIKYRRNKSDNIPHSFELITSDLLNSENLNVSLTDQNGESVDCYKKDGKYEFKADATSGSRTYTVIVQSDNLVQHVGKLTYYYHQEADPIVTVTENKSVTNTKPSKSLIISIKRDNNGRANRDKTCGVTITIDNPNDVSVSTTVNITGSSKLTPVTRKETIPAYGSKKISTTCTNIVKASTETVSVSTSTGERASEKLTFTINQKN